MFKRLTVVLLTALAALSCVPTAESPIEVVTLPSPDSPLVAIRLMFKAGSIHDPEGKEGLAAMTAFMVGQAGTQKRDYPELVEALYPMAASIEVDGDREVTVISGTIHREKLAEFTELLREVLLEPGFKESDFSRHRDRLKAYLVNTLRASNDEMLGLETLQQVLWAGHPYGHAPAGSVAGLDAVTLEDVEAFYRRHYTQANLMLGVAGGYPDGYVDELVTALSALPEGEPGLLELPAPPPVEGRDFTLVEKKTGSVGIHFGYPLPLTRADGDYYPLMVANSYLGEHRTFFGRLMNQLRGKRGLNYGDYSYIEYWHNPPFTSNPSPGFPRRQQYFSVWIRPVVPDTAHFALRAALFEVDRLIERGMTQEEFEITRDFLVNYSKLWARTLDNRLGWLMDSRYLGMDYYIDEIEERLMALTVEEVNAAVKKHIQTDDFQAVFVTDNAAAVEAYLRAGEASPMEYNTPPEAEVVEGDKLIEGLEVGMGECRILPVDQMFQGGSLPEPVAAAEPAV